ncbi:hypothetical protein PHSY_001917 [Pseudozyma hubeiensis SY62]|uniref:Uncharacterized protein n=1 Tax=Pseudozyma hubeiensis (strain SY62) TaxID=1305764 RepID=R9NZV1_PSEHS|nr:hypothetical protein PHSY_001917 [Pseudozyma hubeiensis SY62]GAC94346.1 hypothetical protein PHSY_001917 [Pseudozyma hubeiensis SY62]
MRIGDQSHEWPPDKESHAAPRFEPTDSCNRAGGGDAAARAHASCDKSPRETKTGLRRHNPNAATCSEAHIVRSRRTSTVQLAPSHNSDTSA